MRVTFSEGEQIIANLPRFGWGQLMNGVLLVTCIQPRYATYVINSILNDNSPAQLGVRLASLQRIYHVPFSLHLTALIIRRINLEKKHLMKSQLPSWRASFSPSRFVLGNPDSASSAYKKVHASVIISPILWSNVMCRRCWAIKNGNPWIWSWFRKVLTAMLS